jgi:non-ribosomal peptide synthetase component E (peptide arylation enzyme)
MADWEPREPASDLARGRPRGWWNDDSLGQLIERGSGCSTPPSGSGRRPRPWTGTLGDLLELSTRFAGGLRRLGVGPGDVVAVQLPN